MVWAKLDDEILDNPKIAEAGPLGFALHVAAITWCCRNLTDGFIQRQRVRALLDFDGLSVSVGEGDFVAHGKNANAIELAEHLVSVGLWKHDPAGRGYWLHDFLAYNPSRADVMAEREAKSQLRADAGRKGAAARWKRPGNTFADGKPDGKPDGKAMANEMAKPWQNDGPAPVPDPVPNKKEPPLPPEGGGVVGPADEVHQHYVETIKAIRPRRRPPKLSPKDRKRIQDHLRSGLTVEDLKRAIDGLMLSAHHLGEYALRRPADMAANVPDAPLPRMREKPPDEPGVPPPPGVLEALELFISEKTGT
jgi:hypothetical protein